MQTTTKTADPMASRIGGEAEARSPQHLTPAYQIAGTSVAVYKATDEWDGLRLDRLFQAHHTTGLLRVPKPFADGEPAVWWCAYLDGARVDGRVHPTGWDALFVLLEAMRP